MKVDIVPLERMSIQDFAYQDGLVIKVIERVSSHWPYCRWFARFDGFELKEGSCLVSTFGNGSTVDEAIANYCSLISEKHGVVNAYLGSRKEIYRIPIVHHQTVAEVK